MPLASRGSSAPFASLARSTAMALLLGSMAAFPPLAAQGASMPAAVDTLPFRAGQWGVEFSLGSFSSVGLLRFRSPERAWVGSVGGSYVRSPASPPLSERTNTQVDVQLGHRWLRPVRTNVSQFLTVGPVFGWRSLDTPLPPQSPPGQTTIALPSTSSLFGGISADVGAQWMVTSSLSLGARWQTQAVVGRDRERTRTASGNGNEQTGTSVNVLLGRVGVLGTLYF